MEDLSSIILSLQSEIVLLKSEISLLELENSTLRNENCRLKDRLGLTSKNSSIPSSRELYKLKRNTIKSSRSRGGQPGHSGTTRSKMVSDEVIDLPISDACTCGGPITPSSNPYIHQKVDLPDIQPYVINYHVHHGRCRQCGKRYAASLPQGVTGDTFGPKIKSVIAALTGFYKNSKREVADILKDIFNLDISLGSISNSEARVGSKCQSAYQAIEETVKQSNLIHIDETSHFNSGKLGWCWIFTTPMASLLKLTHSRSRKVLENSGLNHQNSIVISDRYAVYHYFPPTHRQLCWAHLARDFERLAHSCHNGVKRLGVYLKEITSELFALHRAFLSHSMQLVTFLRRIRKLRKRTWYALKATGMCSANGVNLRGIYIDFQIKKSIFSIG
ncbi:IS66 family transposase [Candidatus Cardinium sp. TP]|uniref:IS66 family transposase n=1 Tax=Candidatus Cardinium sp. TP TaxID=2961955 RepID=UPI0021AEE9F6|nr:transposase [Candidatus Cardinium sp. TP]MCT4697186.1 transposase [Candidatus Cardinium sp. TP]MDN5247100.1 transposase [Candidatus Cardinium sp.]